MNAMNRIGRRFAAVSAGVLVAASLSVVSAAPASAARSQCDPYSGLCVWTDNNYGGIFNAWNDTMSSGECYYGGRQGIRSIYNKWNRGRSVILWETTGCSGSSEATIDPGQSTGSLGFTGKSFVLLSF